MKTGQSSQLLSILLLILLVIGVALFIMPLREDIASLRVQKETSAAELQVLEGEYEALSALSKDVASSEASKQALMDAVPTGPMQDELILELSEMAEDAGFELNAMNFTRSVDQDFGNTLNVAANFAGSYNDLISFLQQLETADRLMQVRSMNVQLTTTTEVVFNLSIEAYYQ